MGEKTDFTIYDKITDLIMFFNSDISLKFSVSLSRIKDNKKISYHSEYKYNSSGFVSRSIKREIRCCYIIDDKRNFENSIMIRPQDVPLLQMLLNNTVMPWVVGKTRIYGLDDKNNLIIKGKYRRADFPVSDYKFLAFMPIVIAYDNRTTKEGIRMIMNNDDNFIDIEIGRFMEFYYYINSSDMYCAATNLINYVKMEPYEVNMYDMNERDTGPDWYPDEVSKKGSGNSFFNNLK